MVIHGDHWLPNVLLLAGRLTGVLDVRHVGRGHPGFDIVSADASGRRNLRQDWDLDRFLVAYGERPDPDRIRWLTLLRALLWSLTVGEPVASAGAGPPIYLISGNSGAGKSTVGRALAESGSSVASSSRPTTSRG